MSIVGKNEQTEYWNEEGRGKLRFRLPRQQSSKMKWQTKKKNRESYKHSTPRPYKDFLVTQPAKKANF